MFCSFSSFRYSSISSPKIYYSYTSSQKLFLFLIADMEISLRGSEYSYDLFRVVPPRSENFAIPPTIGSFGGIPHSCCQYFWKLTCSFLLGPSSAIRMYWLSTHLKEFPMLFVHSRPESRETLLVLSKRSINGTMLHAWNMEIDETDSYISNTNSSYLNVESKFWGLGDVCHALKWQYHDK